MLCSGDKVIVDPLNDVERCENCSVNFHIIGKVTEIYKPSKCFKMKYCYSGTDIHCYSGMEILEYYFLERTVISKIDYMKIINVL